MNIAIPKSFRKSHTSLRLLFALLIFLCGLELHSQAFQGHGRRIVVGTELDYPPYSFLNEEGEAAGFNVDLTRAVAEATDLQVEIRVAPWAEIREALDSGEIDVIAGMFYSEERDRTVDFSQAYAHVHQGFFRRSGDPDIRVLDDIRARSIVVMQGDIMDDHLRRLGFDELLISADTLAGALKLFSEGVGDYLAAARLPALYYIEREGLENIEPASLSLSGSEYCFAVSEGERALLTEFSEGLEILHRNGEFRLLQLRWLRGADAGVLTLGEMFRRLAYILLPALLVVMIILFWGIFMRREVRRRTADLRIENELRRSTEEHLNQVNRILEAVRRVNQRIVRAEDVERMMDDICRILVETRGYYNAWIALFDQKGAFQSAHQSNSGSEFERLQLRLEGGDLPRCVRVVLESRQILGTETPADQCEACPLIPLYRDRSALTVPLCLKENCFGVLSVSIPARFFQDNEEAQLLKEIGADIAYALHDHHMRRSLEAALDEKNVLIRELYHRTKNNMQVIASMVALRRFALEDDTQSGVLQEIEGKIHSMALVHQRLYLAKDLSRLDLKSYIQELAELVHSTFEDQSKHIEFDFDLEPADGLIDTAVPLGLVINELLVNAIKHAFPERDSGRILIRLSKIGEGALRVSLEDDGIGLPLGFRPDRAESLGLQTVYNIVTNQLNGSLTVRSNGGTHWDLTVGDVAYKERV